MKTLFALLISITLFGGEPKRRILIDKSDFTLTLYSGDTVEKTFKVALGRNAGDKEKKGDCRTPEGRFRVIQIQPSHTWSHDFKDGNGDIQGAYGPWFLRLYTGADATRSGKKWTGIAIHGTHDRSSIGTLASEGCIRLHNEDITELKALVEVGTPVIIQE